LRVGQLKGRLTRRAGQKDPLLYRPLELGNLGIGVDGALSDIYANLAQSVTLVIRHSCCSRQQERWAGARDHDMAIDGLSILDLLIMALTLAFLTAAIARNKGESYFKWFLAGALVGIIALPIALFKRKKVVHLALKQCPQCAEQLPIQTVVCDKCNYNFLSMTAGCRHQPTPPYSEHLTQ
jgi:hypothetical protein